MIYLATAIVSIIQIILIVLAKGLVLELIPLGLILCIFTYISIRDYQTGEISIVLNFMLLGLAIIYAIMIKIFPIINVVCFTVPFILIESVYQLFFNKEKDEDKFLIGGGDIVLFASISLVLSTVFSMLYMFFVSSLLSLIVSKIKTKRIIPFAPFLQIGMLVSYLSTSIVQKLLFFSL